MHTIHEPLGPVIPTSAPNTRRVIILTLGPNLVGKGENGRLLAEHLSSLNDVPHHKDTHFSLGDYLRDLAKCDLEFTQKYGNTLRQGKLLPDEFVDGIVSSRLRRMSFGVCDGYPRNSHQARQTVEAIKEHGGDVIAVEFMASLRCSLIRAAGRGRPDDNPKIVVNRYQYYMRNRAGVLGTLGFYGIPIHHYRVNEDPSVTPMENFASLLWSLGIPQTAHLAHQDVCHGSEVSAERKPMRGHWMLNIPGMLPAVAA